MKIMNSELQTNKLYDTIQNILVEACNTVRRNINFAMVQAYWQIGRLIVEDEQNGKSRAEYGKATLAELSRLLTRDFGKGFDESNLRYMRIFYLNFPICDALRHELSWTHHRMMSRIEKKMIKPPA